MGEDELGSFARFNTRCADVEQAFSKFRQLQTEGDGSVPYADKQELQKRLKALEDELGVVIFERGGTEISVTPLGAQIVAQAERVLATTYVIDV